MFSQAQNEFKDAEKESKIEESNEIQKKEATSEVKDNADNDKKNKEKDHADKKDDEKEEQEQEEIIFQGAPPKCNSFSKIKELLVTYKNFIDTKPKFESKNILNLTKCIGRIYWDYKKHRIDTAAALIDLQFPEFFKALLVYANNIGVFQSDSIWFPTYYAFSILWNFTDASKDLSKRLLELDFVKYYAANLKHQPYIENQKSKNVSYVIKSSLSTLQNLVRHIPDDPKYDEEDLKTILKPYLSSENDMFRTLTIMILSSLISEDENSKLEDAGSIPYMVKCLNKAVVNAKRRFNGFAVTELLECLIRIAANDKNKIKLVDAGLLPGLVKSMETGDNEEKECAAKLIWVLAFDKENDVKDKISKELGMLEALDSLLKSEDKAVVQAAKGAQWKLSGEQDYQNHRVDDLVDDLLTAPEKKHIFISYQHDDQPVLTQIKDRLKEDNYKVWIDIEMMGGSTLDAMAKAVENAQVVLVCASEKYKLSPNCRTEAEYTFQTKRPIVPLMMQRHYKPDGWLGMLMGAKLYVNFDGKYEFNYAYNMLLRELKPYFQAGEGGEDVVDARVAPIIQPSHIPDVFSAPPLQHQTVTNKERTAASWDSDRLQEWVKNNNLNELNAKLGEFFEKMNGKTFVQFCSLRREAPEYFYNQLQQQFDLDMLAVLQLSAALENII